MERLKQYINISILMCVVLFSVGYSQKKDNTIQKAEQLMKNYKPPVIKMIQQTETPAESWRNHTVVMPQNVYKIRNPRHPQTVHKTLGYHVNMMPSYYSNVTYSNFVLGEGDMVWGNAIGGSAPYHYYLDYGDGNIDSGTVGDGRLIGASHAYAFAGTKTASLLVIDNNGMRDSDETVIRVFPVATKQIRTNRAIERGLLYLYQNQYAQGYWYDLSSSTASTGAALLAFEENGHLGNNDFNQDIYAEFVKLGLNYLYALIQQYPVSAQPAGNPDINGNGYGAYVSSGVYENGIGNLAILGAHSNQSDAQADTITVGVYAGKSVYDYAVDMVDQWAFCQTDIGYSGQGGWRYSINTSNGGSQDASTTQWATLNLEAAENIYGVPIPQFVKDQVLICVQANQNPGNGGFGYSGAYDWVNSTKTAAGLGSLAFLGYTTDSPAVQGTLNFLNSEWKKTGGDVNSWAEPFYGNLYGMYGIAKGNRIINHRAGNQYIGTHDWYEECSDFLLDDATYRQNANGSWPRQASYYPTAAMYDPLNSSLAILILTRGVGQPPPVAVISSVSSKPAGFPFDIDGAESYHQDPEKSIVEYLWDWDASDGVDFDNPDDQGPNPTNPGYDAPGTYTITLRIEDDSDPPLFAQSQIIVVIDPTGPEGSEINHAPVAVPIPHDRQPYYAVPIGVPVLFDGRESFDPDLGDNIVSYSWDLNGDGVYGDATTDTVTRIFDEEFDGEIGLHVTDSRGMTSTNSSYLRIVSSTRNFYVESFEITPKVVFIDSVMHLKAIFRNDANTDPNAEKKSHVLVRFYDNDPLTSGARLGRGDYFVNLQDVGSSDTVEFNFTVKAPFAEGTHSIFAFLDPAEQINEWNEIDNRKSVQIGVGKPNTVTVRNARDNDGKEGTTNDRSPKAWHMSLYHVEGEQSTLVGSTDSSTLNVSSLTAGNYIAVQSDSLGWVRLGNSVDGEAAGTSDTIAFQLSSGQARVIEFTSFLSNTITIRSFVDADGNFGTTQDRRPANWGLTLYRSSISAGNVVLRVDSDTLFVKSSLGSGVYIAVEDDSTTASWTILGSLTTENNSTVTSAGNLNAVNFTLVGGQTKEIDFINSRPTSVLLRKFQDMDGKLATTEDQVQIPYSFSLYHNAVAPENFISSTTMSDTTLKAEGLDEGTYVAVESTVVGYKKLGHRDEDGNLVHSTSAAVEFTLKAGARPVIDFINYAGDTSYFRTVSPDVVGTDVGNVLFAKKANKLSKKKPLILPNFGNVRDSVMKKQGKTPITLGISQTNKDSIKRYGWMTIDKGGVAAFINPTANPAQPFDSIRLAGKKTTKLVKVLKNTTYKKYSNHLANEMFALAFNIYATDWGIFPGSGSAFRNIVYDDGTQGNPYNGLTFSEIKSRVDSAVTYYKRSDLPVNFGDHPNDFDLADSVLTRINRSFASPIVDANDIYLVGVAAKSNGFIAVTGVRSVLDVTYLSPPAQNRNGYTQNLNGVPTEYELSQNYPNPFNPSTTISFSMADNGVVNLKVYNVLGQSVATILNNVSVEAGEHDVVFDASNLSSGVYFVRMEVNGVQVANLRKMVLMK